MTQLDQPERSSSAGPAADTAIRIRGLRKLYAGVPAVDGIDLDVHRGEIFALLGPNGAGKTTTVEILEGYRNRDDGDVSVLGTDPGRGGRAWRSRVGIVLQDTGGHDEHTVEELIGHMRSYYPHPRGTADVIRDVGLEAKASTRVRHLSGGQRRRLDVALGIVGRPELLFLDEPTTGFDPEARREFWGLIRSLTGEGTTIVLTTHYLDEAEQLADRVAVIASGRIVALDSPAQLGDRERQLTTLRWTEGGEQREELTASPTRVIGELSARLGGEVPDLTLTRPTLEDTYLRLIGDLATGRAHTDHSADSEKKVQA